MTVRIEAGTSPRSLAASFAVDAAPSVRAGTFAASVTVHEICDEMPDETIRSALAGSDGAAAGIASTSDE